MPKTNYYLTLILFCCFFSAAWADQIVAPAKVNDGKGHIAINFSPPLSGEETVEVYSKKQLLGTVVVKGKALNIYKMLIPINMQKKRFDFKVMRNGEKIGAGVIRSNRTHRRKTGIGIEVKHEKLNMGTVTSVTIKEFNILMVSLDFNNGYVKIHPSDQWSERPTFFIQTNAKELVEASRFDRDYNHRELAVVGVKPEVASAEVTDKAPPKARSKPPKPAPLEPAPSNQAEQKLPPPPVPCTFTNSCDF